MKYERLYAKVDLRAIGHNVDKVRSGLPLKTMIMAVIKADAYGHGAIEVANYLDGCVDWYGVSNVEEAVELRHNGSKKPILILGATMPDEFGTIVKYDITAAIFDYERAELLNEEAIRQNKQASVHIKLDTGMSRIGLQANDAAVDEVIRISKLSAIEIGGIFTHFARADETDKSCALEQKKLFDSFISTVETKGISFPIKHISNSAGIMELDTSYNMVRMGIMLYGLYPSHEMNKSYQLCPAMELVSHITHIKTLDAGIGISYGHTHITDKETAVATVPVGYADGYPRCLSDKGEVLIAGIKCPILGRICMDQMMVDISAVPDAKVGDEVILVGSMGDCCITVDDVADNAYSFNYEFVCGISRRVPRAYFEGEKYIKTVSYLK